MEKGPVGPCSAFPVQLGQVPRHDAGLNFAASVPVLHDQEIEPPVGGVDAVAVPAKAAPPEVGTSRIVPLPAEALVVIVIIPVASAIPIDVTLLVVAGAVKPPLKGAPAAAFSATDTFAPVANTIPSLTFARIV